LWKIIKEKKETEKETENDKKREKKRKMINYALLTKFTCILLKNY
jgi:hypothetical protein